MSDDFAETYEETLRRANRIAEELEAVDPEAVSRENWEEELRDYMLAVENFEDHKTEIYASIFDETSGKGRIREYLKDKVGGPVRSETLARISGISQYARRVRELRNEEGFVIDSTRTRAELGQNDYFVVEIRDVDEKRRISAQTRYEQLQREETCRICGRGVDHPDVKYMEVDHIESFVDYDDPEAVNDPENLRTLCNECHHGKSAADDVANRRRGGEIRRE
ncbi:HNH endonuclease [Halorussus salilacus]|uniref:HNH endonuclease n=1 Tax=Halorussus salilacus TaxID=2953750 RepID=UPI00209DDEA0|nr:HNH endonuclease [Halorussus salilacus]USZ68738.1 HNH endonuclease [Halorussus salilacus]